MYFCEGKQAFLLVALKEEVDMMGDERFESCWVEVDFVGIDCRDAPEPDREET